MAYDPQSDRRRPRPAADDPAPIDALLGTAPRAAEPAPGPAVDDPPPTPSVTPDPADPPSDRLLVGSGLVGVLGGVVALLTLRHLWLRARRRRGAEQPAAD